MLKSSEDWRAQAAVVGSFGTIIITQCVSSYFLSYPKCDVLCTPPALGGSSSGFREFIIIYNLTYFFLAEIVHLEGDSGGR